MYFELAEREGGVMKDFMAFVGHYMESYRRDMKEFKKAEQMTPKEYGMRLQRSKKKRKVIKRGK